MSIGGLMSREDLCSEAEIVELVHQFYGRIREDAELGPIFNAHVHDWDRHLATMVSFWSSLLIGAGTYDGTPMPKHVALPGLRAELFERWLDIFALTADSLDNKQLAERAKEYARRIARSLWFGYQFHHAPEATVQDLGQASKT